MAQAPARTLKIEDVMTHDPRCVRPSCTIRELARMLEEEGFSGAPVVDDDGALVGVVSRTDLIRRCLDDARNRAPMHLFELLHGEGDDSPTGPLIVVADFMTANPITARADEPVEAIALRMARARVHRVVVVDAQQRPTGIVTSLDLLKFWPGR
jgi:CBS domain-containing protein